MPDKLLATAEVAARLKVGVSTVTKWCNEGLFAGAFKTQPGPRGDWRIPEASLQSLAESGVLRERIGRPHALTADQRDAVRKRLAAGEKPSALAAEYGVSYRTIYRLRIRD